MSSIVMPKILMCSKLITFLIKDKLKYIINAKQGPATYMNSAAIPKSATFLYSSVDLSIIL